jgi:hypothetical protein
MSFSADGSRFVHGLGGYRRRHLIYLFVLFYIVLLYASFLRREIKWIEYQMRWMWMAWGSTGTAAIGQPLYSCYKGPSTFRLIAEVGAPIGNLLAITA